MSKCLTVSGQRFKTIFKWDKFQSSREWAEKNIYLNSDVSPITGFIDMRYTPHLIEMFNDYDIPSYWKFTFMASSQCGKTTCIFALAFKQLDTDPSMSNIFIPADDGVRDYVVQKLNPFLKGIKSVIKKIEQHNSQEDNKDIKATKTVAGGMLGVSGSSARQRRSKTLKNVFLDEVSLFPIGSVTEIISRTKAFEKYFRKVFLSSTIKEDGDQIMKSYKDSEWKKEWHIRCHDCNNTFYPESKHFKYMTIEEFATLKNIKVDDINDTIYEDYKSKALEDVYVECPHCSHKIDSKEKDRLVLNNGCEFVTVAGDSSKKTIGYKANALAMYATNYETIAGLLIDAKGKYDEIAIVYIEYFNEIYAEKKHEINTEDMLLLGNGLRKWEIHEETVRLYLTIDTQKDHFYWKITAFGYGFIANTVAYGRAETTHDLKELMFNTYYGLNGRAYMIDKVCIDRRGIAERTTQVDEFIIEIMEETGELDFIYATEGVSEIAGGQMYRVKRYKKELDGEKYEFKVISISNIMAKKELSNMISRSIAKAKDETGEKDYHRRLFAINDDIVDEEKDTKTTIHSYTRHMTSEEISIVKGKEVWEKKNSSVRNDYWDCSVQAIVLAEMELVSNMQKPEFSEDDGSKLLSLIG
jgi:phage terminase large subunit GpA-like protein